MAQEYQQVSPSDFFYRNREIAGFSNPSRAIYVGVRELLENSLDACESRMIPPDIYLRITELSTSNGENGTAVYLIRIQDNGTGFDVAAVTRSYSRQGSLGMVILQERSELINGVLNVVSSPGAGTCVQVYIPLTAEAADSLHRANQK